MDEKKLQLELQELVRDKLYPLFARYYLDPRDMEAILKWKPIVLLLGNYSSGKSTLVNELLGDEIQRTGQAPTDDSFTVITAPESDEKEIIHVPGATLVNDDRLPFTALKAYGDQLVAHFQMKQLNTPVLDNLAIIDSPGMLDSVTEKGRGYDFHGVVGELAKLADLVVLMFDPHKAGTIKETYSTIRNTLPDKSDEDRIVFVMSRIDECDNPADLVRSYGTLCWNLSQMTGRKDIPRIFLTYSRAAARNPEALAVWQDERNQLEQKILDAPGLRISHILQKVDKQINELRMVAEAMANFNLGGRRVFRNFVKSSLLIAVLAFLFLDVICMELFGQPSKTFLSSLISNSLTIEQLTIPLAGAVISLLLMAFLFLKWRLPRYVKKCQENIDNLVNLDTAYRETTWSRIKNKVSTLISDPKLKGIYYPHPKNLNKIEKFIKEDLNKYYEMIR